MNVFIDLEKFLSQKQLPFKYLLLICIFLFFFLFAVVVGIADDNYCAVIASIAIGIVCIAFFREIKKLHAQNNLTNFQKNLATNAFDASMFAFFVFAENGKCVFINRVAQNLFPGFKMRTIEDFIVCFGKYPQVVDAIRNLQIAVENGKQSHIDVPIKLHSDSTAVWRISVSPVPMHSGFYGWTLMDLTLSDVRVDSLETSSGFLLDIVNNSNVGYVSLNDNNEIVFCNNTFSNWVGTSAENLVNRDFARIIEKESSDELTPTTTYGKLTSALPIKVTLKSEMTDNVSVSMRKILKTEAGLSVYIVTREIQQSGDLMQALGQTKMYFEHIFEDAPVGIVITDGPETIKASNRIFRSLIGEKDIDSTSFVDYLVDEAKENIREKLYNVFEAVHKSLPPFEVQFKTNDKRSVMVYVTKIDESKRSKENDGLVMYFIDVTERKELQHQFVQSQKMQAVGQLAGGIAHDFNNLLTAMIGYCDLLLEKYLPSDQSFNDVMQIKQNANRASNLVRQLLAFSRQQTLQPKTLSVTDMISELSALLKRLLGAQITLEVMHGRDLGFVKVDQVQFEQVIINLAVNARDAMQDGGILKIQTSAYVCREPKFLRGDTMPPGRYVLIEVIDSGCGIDAMQLSRIFDPFFSTKEKGRGTGLGLSTVYGIVNQTGGFISVESEVGHGTTFSIYFPMILESETECVSQDDNQQDRRIADLTGSGTILLVEDEDAVRMFSARALRDKGYRVIEASNGEAALEYIRKGAGDIDLIVSDVVMPKMDGPTLIKQLREYSDTAKVIFISGYTEDGVRESIANDRGVHFLPKPFNLKELASKVKEVLNN